ncbi:uncharacterized protein EI90DRAFT_641988 [Cantharellus anzutake]|uniref:uncharacterized protein n=1 Tax=Cantharellus anzutake TaxID=1750568 RepID=UPI001904545B|nr:uncharacterized protein EI90DRAFT_641988 [Cantharellus anzutake]KAF8333225.1 hypothetical protein EI90DRAFT_641988 [Cantharellus anzutake]
MDDDSAMNVSATKHSFLPWILEWHGGYIVGDIDASPGDIVIETIIGDRHNHDISTRLNFKTTTTVRAPYHPQVLLKAPNSTDLVDPAPAATSRSSHGMLDEKGSSIRVPSPSTPLPLGMRSLSGIRGTRQSCYSASRPSGHDTLDWLFESGVPVDLHLETAARFTGIL